MHGTILRSIRDVQRLAGRPYTFCNLIETVYRVAELKHLTLMYITSNMFESIHTKGVMKIYEMVRKKDTCSLRVNTLY
jgi:hypothetical protein